MLKNGPRIGAVLFLALSGVFLACAQGNDRQQPRVVMDALDLNHDGKLSAAELQAAPASLLKLDRNGDGQVALGALIAVGVFRCFVPWPVSVGRGGEVRSPHLCNLPSPYTGSQQRS